jgi:methionyl-tRNA formyltransferase
MQMDAGLDTGAMLLTDTLSIAPDDTTASLHDRLAEMGGDLMVQALVKAQAGQLKPVVQPEAGVSYAHKIDKAEAAVDWTQAAEVIARRVRAFNPFPGAAAHLSGEAIKLWQVHVQARAHDVKPGTVLSADDQGVCVACGQDVLCVTQLQRAGAKRLSAAEFLRGFALKPGQCLDGMVH